MTEAFYRQLADDRVEATEHAEGPWARGAQHGGPPAALLGRAVEAASSHPDWLTARYALDILGPIPVGVLRIAAEVSRPGRSVELITAELSTQDKVVARAAAWRIRTATGVPATPRAPAPGPLPPAGSDEPDWPGGYLAAIEWRFAAGPGLSSGFGRPALGEPVKGGSGTGGSGGAATVWGRPRIPLVAGEAMTPLQRVLLLADSGNGVSSSLPLERFWFINPELTVHLHRLPVGEWICLQARTTVAEQGVGLAESVLADADGVIGRGAQALLIGPRPAGEGSGS